jgi:hypothetical protein
MKISFILMDNYDFHTSRYSVTLMGVYFISVYANVNYRNHIFSRAFAPGDALNSAPKFSRNPLRLPAMPPMAYIQASDTHH